MTGHSAVIEVCGATKAYGTGTARRVVLEDVHLRLLKSEFVCVVGASGSGKSTLLHLVAGLDTATEGRIGVTAGRPAVMFQDHALFPWLTAGKNVELALRLAGIAPGSRREQARSLLALVGLAESHGQRVHELSGGMRQRVALARALAQGTDVLLMDEPFAALDAVTRRVLHAELLRVCAERGTAVLFVTHDVGEAVALADRVVLMSSDPGRVVAEWSVGLRSARGTDTPDAAGLVDEITARLGEEADCSARR
ncbi:ABC transporter ATP-binding protein [Streptomyces candidus]|uniref:NitT/TauT family transport system ATP-binding protein n=1 Tax=Streptomyces candidus TaxID=67283 RepID=A0A7X0HNU4_9ACTN|nr:ABC transporter ATP-binding protein [Streptomyces candidus]MBB6439762.1 NitT/TauT family transport system ATP-binding protein [Streptomyces candidus]GHH57012.1 ABC transporter ATP-binding protein [Streptomyces candidus]